MEVPLDRRLELIRFACAAAVARFGKRNALSDFEADIKLTEADLRYLFAQNIDSAAYLAYEPNSPIQRLYQALFAHQKRLAKETGDLFEAAGLNWAYVQGIEVTHTIFQGHAFGRRSDVDVLVAEKDALRAMEILSRHKLGQFALKPDSYEPVLISKGLAQSIVDTKYYKKIYPFARLEQLDLPHGIAEMVPRMINPIFRQGESICTLVAIEPVTSYAEGIETQMLLATRGEYDQGMRFLDSDWNFLLSAKRLCDGLGRQEARLRLLCELAVRQALGVDLDAVGQTAERFGVQEPLALALDMIEYALSGPNREPPGLLLRYIKANS